MRLLVILGIHILFIGSIYSEFTGYSEIYESRKEGYLFMNAIIGKKNLQKQALILDTTTKFTRTICLTEKLAIPARKEKIFEGDKSESFIKISCNENINNEKCKSCNDKNCQIELVFENFNLEIWK